MSEDLYFAILDLILQAGDQIRNVASAGELYEKEGNANYVTNYDLQIQRFLISHLSGLCPEASFLCEEEGYKDTLLGDGYTFIIDPIDGTTNFICDFKMSAICVALTKGREPVMGFVFNPYTNEMFTACKGKGAYLNGRRIKSPDRSLKDGVTLVGLTCYNPELRDRVFKMAKETACHTMDIRDIGCAGIAICYVACGRSTAYATALLNPWDYAAGALIASESGAICCDWKGADLDYQTKNSFLAASPKAAEEYLSILKDIR